MNNFVGHLTRKKVKGNTEQQDLSSTLTSLNLVGTEDVGQSLSGNIIEREIFFLGGKEAYFLFKRIGALK